MLAFCIILRKSTWNPIRWRSLKVHHGDLRFFSSEDRRFLKKIPSLVVTRWKKKKKKRFFLFSLSLHCRYFMTPIFSDPFFSQLWIQRQRYQLKPWWKVKREKTENEKKRKKEEGKEKKSDDGDESKSC